MGDLVSKHKFTGMSVTLPVKDVKATINWYVGRLGFKPYFYVDDPRECGGVRLGRTEICFCKGEPLDRRDQSVYFDISQPDELFQRYKSEGLEVVFEPKDQSWGSRDFAIRDPSGNILIFGDERDAGEANQHSPAFLNALRCIQTNDVAGFEDLLNLDPTLPSAQSPFPNDRDSKVTLLHCLMSCPHVREVARVCEFARLLINSGADVETLQGPGDGSTALQLLMCNSERLDHIVDLTKLLLDAGASTARVNDNHGMDAFTLALLHGQTESASVMFDQGYPANFSWAGAGLGQMKLLRAFFGEGEVVALPADDRAESLSEHEAECRMNCAFLVAAINGQTEAIEFLLSKGMDVDMQPPGSDFAGIGGTALHWATRYGHIDTVKTLAARGANVLAQDDIFGLTPAGWAGWYEQEEARSFLLDLEQEAAA